jgi:hypothetical protein
MTKHVSLEAAIEAVRAVSDDDIERHRCGCPISETAAIDACVSALESLPPAELAAVDEAPTTGGLEEFEDALDRLERYNGDHEAYWECLTWARGKVAEVEALREAARALISETLPDENDASMAPSLGAVEKLTKALAAYDAALNSRGPGRGEATDA